VKTYQRLGFEVSTVDAAYAAAGNSAATRGREH
jgi:hypothetical protein